MDLVRILERLNRKERFFLFKSMIDQHCFVLSDLMRQQLMEELAHNIPKGAFFAVDYHLDW